MCLLGPAVRILGLSAFGTTTRRGALQVWMVAGSNRHYVGRFVGKFPDQNVYSGRERPTGIEPA